MLAPSVVAYMGEHKRDHCGYCNSKDPSVGNYSVGMWAYVLDVGHYNDLLDRGMRRSGKYLYKPLIAKTCCPQYTIRLNVSKFHISKSQKKVLRQMNDFLLKDKKPSQVIDDVICNVDNRKGSKKFAATFVDTTVGDEGKAGASNVVSLEEVSLATAQIEKSRSITNNPKKEPTDNESVGKKGLDIENSTSSHLCRQNKKKEIRKQKAFTKMRNKGINVEEAIRLRAEKETRRRKTLETYINEYNNNKDTAAHKLEINLVPVKSRVYMETKDEAYNLYYKYQTTVHLESSCTKEEFDNFLGSSPLQRAVEPLGTYHMQYRLDDKLFAVGVLDVLPRCVSAKYFFYDPDYKFLSMGTFAALREIYLTKKFSKEIPGLDYYCMGYYIESCPKMRYKGRFRPSDLLCDTSFTWVPFEECKRQLEQSDRVTAFANNARPPAPVPYSSMLCMYNREINTYNHLPRAPEVIEMEEQVKEYANIVGPVGQEMVLIIV